MPCTYALELRFFSGKFRGRVVNIKPGKEEEGFDKALSTLHENIGLASQFLVTFRAFFDALRYDDELEESINGWRRYWNLTLHGWQAGLFFSLGRIYDNNGYSLKQIFKIAKKHRHILSLESLAARKRKELSQQDVDSYMEGKTELSGSYLDQLADEVERYIASYNRACKPVRDKVYAHSLLADSEERSSIFRDLDNAEIFTLIAFAKAMDNALHQLYHNGDAMELPLEVPRPHSIFDPVGNESWRSPHLDRWQLADEVAEFAAGIRNLRRTKA